MVLDGTWDALSENTKSALGQTGILHIKHIMIVERLGL